MLTETIINIIFFVLAGAVIRMTEHFLTTPVFKTALNIYLNNRCE